MIEGLFKSIDEKNTAQFMSYLHPQAVFRFGNQPEVKGTEAVSAYVAGFLASVKAISHSIEVVWPAEQGIVCHGTVTYTRMDDSQLTVPFCNLMSMQEGLIRDYLIFADVSGLYP